MKRLLCWLKTIWEFDTFWMAWTTYGAVYVAHEYVEYKNTKHTQIIKCKVCEDESVARWKGINPFWNSSNANKRSLKTERNNNLKGGL